MSHSLEQSKPEILTRPDRWVSFDEFDTILDELYPHSKAVISELRDADNQDTVSRGVRLEPGSLQHTAVDTMAEGLSNFTAEGRWSSAKNNLAAEAVRSVSAINDLVLEPTVMHMAKSIMQDALEAHPDTEAYKRGKDQRAVSASIADFLRAGYMYIHGQSTVKHHQKNRPDRIANAVTNTVFKFGEGSELPENFPYTPEEIAELVKTSKGRAILATITSPMYGSHPASYAALINTLAHENPAEARRMHNKRREMLRSMRDAGISLFLGGGITAAETQVDIINANDGLLFIGATAATRLVKYAADRFGVTTTGRLRSQEHDLTGEQQVEFDRLVAGKYGGEHMAASAKALLQEYRASGSATDLKRQLSEFLLDHDTETFFDPTTKTINVDALQRTVQDCIDILESHLAKDPLYGIQKAINADRGKDAAKLVGRAARSAVKLNDFTNSEDAIVDVGSTLVDKAAKEIVG